jgi:hypothetical protein|tara:strand:+ start:402 stop:602 length:201 start_codon:yes stop_codon:yes gene_type:complete
MSLIPIKDERGLFKDSHSGAIVNKNNSEYQAYIAQREKLLSDKERLDKVENEISDIKQMLQILIDK